MVCLPPRNFPSTQTIGTVFQFNSALYLALSSGFYSESIHS